MARDAAARAADLLLHSRDPIPVAYLRRSLFTVASSRGGSMRYTVDLGQDPPSCTCPRFRFLVATGDDPAPACKHIEAARLAIRARQGLGVPLPPA